MKKQQPKYTLHKATGQARVRIDGKSIYLGEYGSEESRRRYDEVVTECMKGTLNVSFCKLTIAQLCMAYDMPINRRVSMMKRHSPLRVCACDTLAVFDVFGKEIQC